MKKLVLGFIIFASIFLYGCDKEKPILLTNSKPITTSTVQDPIYVFAPHQRIFYVIIVPKGFTDSVIRVQLVKRDEKLSNWGLQLYQSETINVDKGKKFYIGYTTLPEVGCYIIRAFEINNLEKEIARNILWVR